MRQSSRILSTSRNTLIRYNFFVRFTETRLQPVGIVEKSWWPYRIPWGIFVPDIESRVFGLLSVSVSYLTNHNLFINGMMTKKGGGWGWGVWKKNKTLLFPLFYFTELSKWSFIRVNLIVTVVISNNIFIYLHC